MLLSTSWLSMGVHKLKLQQSDGKKIWNERNANWLRRFATASDSKFALPMTNRICLSSEASKARMCATGSTMVVVWGAQKFSWCQFGSYKIVACDHDMHCVQRGCTFVEAERRAPWILDRDSDEKRLSSSNPLGPKLRTPYLPLISIEVHLTNKTHFIISILRPRS